MNKTQLVKSIIEMLEKDWRAAKDIALATYEAATHEESKPENQYDTRALENSYLAGAQAQRILDLEENIASFRGADLKNFEDNKPIEATALVEVENDGKKSCLFVMPRGGGIKIQFEGRQVQVITPSSPLGEALLGLSVGGVAIVENGPMAREYEILSVR